MKPSLLYRSTRSDAGAVTASCALLSGLAPDGGLYVPERLPLLPARLVEELSPMAYPEVALETIAPFFPSFDRKRLARALGESTARFEGGRPAPVVERGGRLYLELFHGPTLAFKDLALTLFGSLLRMAQEEAAPGRRLLVLAATSGDTGKAALEGLRALEGVHVMVFYPRDGVSRVQRLQMASHDDPRAAVVGVRGSFDDAQRGVKAFLSSAGALSRLSDLGFAASSANSINIGRLAPQIAYYVWAYRELRSGGKLGPGDRLDIVVPTGNFGNILAAWYAKRMGLPLGVLVSASNENRVLDDFFDTGRYDRRRPFVRTESPSMDILVSSNLERLVFSACGEDPARTAFLMRSLSEKGEYGLSDRERAFLAGFRSGWASDEEAAKEAGEAFARDGYLMDTHTAVAARVGRELAWSGEISPGALVVSTASPFKFPRAVARAIGMEAGDDGDGGELGLAARLAARAGIPLPRAIADLEGARELHTACVEPDDIEGAILRYATGARP